MPIHLAPISRRQFLARAMAAGAGLALGRDLLAAPKALDKHSWALLSDIHLAANRALTARGINMTDHFAAVLREVQGLPQRPAGLFITGDCAYNSGQKCDYGVLADLLKPIRADRIPVHLALGNHDNRQRFWEALREEKAARRPLADKQATCLKTPYANWYLLDSLETTLSSPGLLGPEQLDWLAHALDADAATPALVLVHHNPGLMGGQVGLKDTEALLEILRPRRQVKAYIYGHTHAWNVEPDSSGIHLINLPPVAYVFKQGDPAGWAHATLKPNGLRLELRCLDAAHQAQGKVHELEWRT